MSAKVVYVRFPVAGHRAAVDWMLAVDDFRLLHRPNGDAPASPAPTSGPVTGWRLVSDNYREIGRGSRLLPGERDAWEDVARLVRRGSELAVHAPTEQGLRTTGWFVTLDDQVVMISARRYENRSVARNAGVLAVRLLTQLSAPAARPGAGDHSAPEFAL